MKICTKCGIEKPLDEFYKDARCADGRYSACKLCARQASTNWKQANAEDVADYAREYRLAQPETVASRMRDWRAKNKEKYKNTGLAGTLFATPNAELRRKRPPVTAAPPGPSGSSTYRRGVSKCTSTTCSRYPKVVSTVSETYSSSSP